MNSRKFNKTVEWLYNEYITKDRTIEEVAKECNLTRPGLKSLLAKHSIRKPIFNRPVSQIEELLNSGKSTKEIQDILKCGRSTIYRVMKERHLHINYKPVYSSYNNSKDELICSLYIDGASSAEIAKELGLTPKTIINHLRHCKIPIRSAQECQLNLNGKVYHQDFTSYDTMYKLYIEEKKSKKDLALLYNVDPSTIDTILKSLNIPIRDNSESKIGLLIGDKHPNWKGGITTLNRRLREAFQVQLAPKILKRDNYTCQICGAKGKLHVHHIRHFKDILIDILKENSLLTLPKDLNKLYEIAVKDKRFLDMDNLITYCPNCHYNIAHKRNIVCGE